MYFRGIVRDEAWNSLMDTARSHADHEFGCAGGIGLGLTVIQRTAEGINTARIGLSCVGRPNDRTTMYPEDADADAPVMSCRDNKLALSPGPR